MALIECLECKKQVSSEANTCPHCGISIKKDTPIVVSPVPTALITPVQPQLIEPGFEPAWGNVFLGILLIFLCTWLAFFFIPSHNPELLEKFLYKYPGKIVQDLLQKNPSEAITAIMRASEGKLPYGCPEWVFKKEYYLYSIVAAYVFLALGIIITLSGFFYKNYKILFCNHCNSQTIARKKFLGFLCEKCNTNLQRASLPFLLLILFLLLFFILIAFIFNAKKSSTSPNIQNFSNINTYTPKIRPWNERATLALEELLKKPDQRKLFGMSIVNTLHPSGTYRDIIAHKVFFDKEKGCLSLVLMVEWSGAITANRYKTTIVWRFNQSGPINMSITQDNAPFAAKQDNLNMLYKWFCDSVWPVVKNNSQ